MTYNELYRQGENSLQASGIPDAGLEARLLLEYACGISRSRLLAHGEETVGEAGQEAYRELVARRATRIPLQLLTGVQEFMGLEFAVDGHVLIPRFDTEVLVEEVLKNLHDGMCILDMCTGSGCILISLLHYSNGCRGVGVDISPQALELAEKNAGRLLKEKGRCGEGGQNCGVTFLRSDLFEDVTGKFDIIVSNPPYIRSSEIGTLMPEVRDYEPRAALDGGEDGLFYYRGIVENGRRFLFGGGKLFFEIGCDQAEAVAGLMEEAGFLDINVVKDYAGLDRVVYGTLGFGS